jgi:hypothetical protein
MPICIPKPRKRYPNMLQNNFSMYGDSFCVPHTEKEKKNKSLRMTRIIGTKTHSTVIFCSFPKVDGISPLTPELSTYLFGRNIEQKFNIRISGMISNVLYNGKDKADLG